MPDKIARALTARPTFQRDITRNVTPEPVTLPLGAPSIIGDVVDPNAPGGFAGAQVSGSPRFGNQIFPPIEQQTETKQIKGAPRGLTFLADFLTGFGAGPQAAIQQQAFRRQGRNLQFDIAQQQADRQAAFQQRQFQNKLSLRRLAVAEREKVPSSFGQLAVQAFIEGNPSRAREILAFSRRHPNSVRERSGRDLVLLDPATLKEITRKKNFFPAARADTKLFKANQIGQIASALLLEAAGDVEKARNLALVRAQQDPSGFAAKNFDKLLKAINSTNLRSSGTLAEILLQLFQESNR